MHRIAQSAATAALILMITTPASAQPSVSGDNRGCAQPGNSENLNDELAPTGGIICPQNIDPAIKAPTPPAADKPVVRPPGGPGGNPNIEPK